MRGKFTTAIGLFLLLCTAAGAERINHVSCPDYSRLAVALLTDSAPSVCFVIRSHSPAEVKSITSFAKGRKAALLKRCAVEMYRNASEKDETNGNRVVLPFRRVRCGYLTVYLYTGSTNNGETVCVTAFRNGIAPDTLVGSILFGTRLSEAVGVCVGKEKVIYKEYKPSVTGPFGISVLTEPAGK